jgi:hypothetical protein
MHCVFLSYRAVDPCMERLVDCGKGHVTKKNKNQEYLQSSFQLPSESCLYTETTLFAGVLLLSFRQQVSPLCSPQPHRYCTSPLHIAEVLVKGSAREVRALSTSPTQLFHILCNSFNTAWYRESIKEVAMISATKNWLRRNRTPLAIGFGVVGVGYVATQYVLGKISSARERMSSDRIAREKYYTPIFTLLDMS